MKNFSLNFNNNINPLSHRITWIAVSYEIEEPG